MGSAISLRGSEPAEAPEPGPPSGAGARSLWDSRAAARFDTFLFAAAATVLVTRAYLAAAGYPQIGGSSGLHIAHVLWGGLLMGTAIAVLIASLGSSAKYWASLVGGVGFGLFIDEVGKFLTKDVDYFFRPAIAVMYGTLLSAYLIGREWFRRRRLDESRVRAIAAAAIVDAELGQLSDGRRADVKALLAGHSAGDQSDALLAVLDAAVGRSRRSADEIVVSFRDRLHRGFLAAARRRWVRVVVFTLMSVQAGLSLLAIVLVAVVLPNIGPEVVAGLTTADIISLAGIVLQTLLLTFGLVLMVFHRWRRGLQSLRAGLFVALMFTTLLEFGQEQFAALATFLVVVVLFAIVGAAAEAERRGEIGPKRSRRARPPGCAGTDQR